MATSTNSTPRLFKFTDNDQILSISTKDDSCFERWSKMDANPSDDYSIALDPPNPPNPLKGLFDGLLEKFDVFKN